MARSAEASSVQQIETRWYPDWVKQNVPDQTGRVVIVTGSNSGTGFWCASALAGKGAQVILACRTVEKAEAAKQEILQTYPAAQLDVIRLDNMDFSSVRAFAEAFKAKYDRLDVLVNNAGIMAQPLTASKDGFDVQFQSNHLAHFLLTSLLWDLLLKTGGARVVQHSSAGHLGGTFSRGRLEHPAVTWRFCCPVNCVFPCLGLPQGHWRRYSMTKLCNILFGLELQKRIEAAGLGGKVISTMAHPGGAATSLAHTATEAGGMTKRLSMSAPAQSAADGALPLLMACVGDVPGGTYLGPKKFMKGPPQIEKPGGYSHDEAMAKDLWSYSEQCCGISFEIAKG